VAVCSITNSNNVGFIGAGICTVRANQQGNTQYNAAPQVTQSFVVNQGYQGITFSSAVPTAAVVAGPFYTAIASSNVSLPVGFTIRAAAASVCSVSGSIVTFLTVGTCIVDGNQAGTGSYNAAAVVSQSFAVGKGAQTISIQSTAPTNAQVNGFTYSMLASSSGSLPLTFTSATPLVCQLAGNKATFLTSGTCKNIICSLFF
jgi:hypothetical protein